MECRRRGIGITKVLFHHIGALDLNFALNTAGAFMTISIRDTRLIADRFTRRTDFMQVGIQGVDQTLRGRFGQAQRFHNGQTKAILKCALCFNRQRG